MWLILLMVVQPVNTAYNPLKFAILAVALIFESAHSQECNLWLYLVNFKRYSIIAKIT